MDLLGVLFTIHVSVFVMIGNDISISVDGAAVDSCPRNEEGFNCPTKNLNSCVLCRAPVCEICNNKMPQEAQPPAVLQPVEAVLLPDRSDHGAPASNIWWTNEMTDTRAHEPASNIWWTNEPSAGQVSPRAPLKKGVKPIPPGLWFPYKPKPRQEKTKGIWFMEPETYTPSKITVWGWPGWTIPGLGIAQSIFQSIFGGPKNPASKPQQKSMERSLMAEPFQPSNAIGSTGDSWLSGLLSIIRTVITDKGPHFACSNDMVMTESVINLKNGITGASIIKGIAEFILNLFPFLRKLACSSPNILDMLFQWIIDYIFHTEIVEPITPSPPAPVPPPPPPPPEPSTPEPPMIRWQPPPKTQILLQPIQARGSCASCVPCPTGHCYEHCHCA